MCTNGPYLESSSVTLFVKISLLVRVMNNELSYYFSFYFILSFIFLFSLFFILNLDKKCNIYYTIM